MTKKQPCQLEWPYRDVRILLRQCKDGRYLLNSCDYVGRTKVLHHACAGGNLSLVERLVTYFGADVKSKDSMHGDIMPLHVAAFTGNETVALALIRQFGCA